MEEEEVSEEAEGVEEEILLQPLDQLANLPHNKVKMCEWY